MPAVFDPTQPYSPVDEALSGNAPLNPASPVDAALAAVSAVPAPPAAPAPVAPKFDPTQPFTPLPETPATPGTRFDPSATFTKQFTPEDVRAQTADVLDKEKDFEPTDFGLQHEADLNADPALKEKVLEIYRRRSQDFRDLKDLAAEAGGHPLKTAGKLGVGALETLGSIGKGVGQLLVNANEAANPLVVVPRLLGHIAGEGARAGVNTTLTEAARSAAEIPTSVEANITGLQGLARKTVREVTEKAAAIDPTGFVRDMTGAKPKTELTPKEWRARFEDDVAGKRAAVDAVRGQGYLMQALGLNADELKSAGIEIRPEVVAKLQPATDPLNFVLLGEGTAIGAVGRVGGRFVVDEIATAATKQEASQFVRALNATAEAAGKVTNATGEGLEATGTALREKIFRPLHNLGDVAGVALSAGGHGRAGLGIIAVTKLSARALELAGQGLQKVAPVIPGAARLGADVGIEGAKGFGEGLLLTAPFTIGADPTEREGLLHAAALGGVARAGVRAGGLAGKAAATVAQEQLAKQIFKEIEQAPKPPEFTYGTDPALDATHAAQIVKAPEGQQKVMGWLRSLFKDSGIEMYVGDPGTFKNEVGTGNAFGSSVKIGQTVDAAGNVKPLVRIFLNGDAEALPHEAFHALEQVNAPGAKEFIAAVNKTLTPAERNYFGQVYNTLLNPGKPEAHWTQRLSPEGISHEVAAEVFSRMVLGQDLSGVESTVMKKAALFVSSLLEKAGVPLGNVQFGGEGPGRSTLGIRPTAEAAKLGSDFVQNFLKQIQERGNVLPAEPLKSAVKGGTLTPGEISRVKRPAQPVAPTPVTPPSPAPTPGIPPRTPTPGGNQPVIDVQASVVPKGGTPVTNPPLPKPRNIRTTTSKQNDFAAKRAEVTNIDKAKEAAAKTGDANTIARVDEISNLVENGNPVLEIEHSGVKNEGNAAAPTGRTSRRSEQEEAYIKEGLGAAPKDVRDAHQKTFSFVRWEVVGGKPQLLAMSLDKVIANVYRAVKEAVGVKKESLIPYEVKGGKLTDAAWSDAVRDLQSYAENQANGYRGDGGILIRPAEDVGLSIPAQNPSYNPVQISGPKADFLNMIQGLNPPLTAREVKGTTPGNVKGQILAEANAKTPQTPTVIRPQDIQKQTFKSGHTIKETNPLRNELAAAGAKVRELIEVTERINAEEINSVTPRPDINFKAPVTDTIRGGLLPGKEAIEEAEGGATRFIKRQTTDQIGKDILAATAENWQETTTEVGGLTGAAYKVGERLKNAGDVEKLRGFEREARQLYDEAKSKRDIDGMMLAATKKQFFTEALETATGSAPGKRELISRVLGPDWKPPFPEITKAGTTPGPDASGALPGNKLATPDAPVGSVGKGFSPPESPRPDNTALAIPVEGVDSPVKYAGEKDGLTPMRFLPKVAGDEHTPPSPSYPDADRLARERKGNAWVRQSADPTNKERILLVQFTPELMYPNGPDKVSTPYYDKLYSGTRKGFSRATDFWEIPQWAAIAAHNLGSKADFYAVRDMAEAKAFLEQADYGRVAFSVMDVSKAVTEELVPHIKGQVDLGGYTDRTGAVAKNPNAKIWDSMNAFIEAQGVKYEKGFDYRHFRGTEIIPRLELSAGCRHRCTFCTIDRKVTNSPLEEINAQVDAFGDLNAKLVYLNDKTFGQSPNVAEMPRLYKEMKAANPEFEGFVIQTTAAQMKTFTDKFLKDSGIRYIELGVETYNDPILKELRKPATEKLIDEAVEKLRRNKINFIPNIVIGFPGETVETYGRTMDFLNKNADVVSHLNTYNLAVYEGTEISKKIETKTAADADENSFNKSFYADPKIHEDFAKSLYDYGTQQLNKETPFREIQKGQLLPKNLPEYLSTPDQAPMSPFLEQEIKELGVSKEFWLNSKTGKILVSDLGHEDAAIETVLKDWPEREDSSGNPADSVVIFDEMERRGWIRGVRAPAISEIALNTTRDEGTSKSSDILSSSARRTLSDLSEKTGRGVIFNKERLHDPEGTKPLSQFVPPRLSSGQLLPSTEFAKELDPIKSAAIRTKGGNIFVGSWHGEALDHLVQAVQEGKLNEKLTATINPNEPESAYDKGELTDGFITSSGKFLDRQQAYKHAEDIQQLDKNKVDFRHNIAGVLESQDFKNSRQFLPGRENPQTSKLEANKEIQDVAEAYKKSEGLKTPRTTGYSELNLRQAKKFADFYEAAKHDPKNTEVVKSYQALVEETRKQFEAMQKAGIVIQPLQGKEVQAYKTHRDVDKDVRENKRVVFLKTTGGEDKTFANSKDNPLLEKSGVVIDGHELVNNDLFRAVHDYFGHLQEGYPFSARGEFNAWRKHSEMYSPEAQGALAAETLTQNAWVNFGPHLRNSTGDLIQRDQPGYTPYENRPFAEQKAFVVPPALINEARGDLLPKKLSAEDIQKKKAAPGAIHAAAVRLDDGTIVTGAIHATAISAALERDPYYQGGFQDGYLTNDGKFLTRKEAQLRAEDIQQVPKGKGLAGSLGYMETKEFEKNRRFLPAKKKKSIEEQVAETDYSKYDVEKKATPGVTTGWILPNRVFVPLEASYHEQYLADNADQLNSQFGTKFSAKPDVKERLDALNSGFVRIRGGFNGGGSLNMEMNARYFKNPTRKAAESFLADRAEDIDRFHISLLDDTGNVVDSADARVFDLEGKARAEALLNSLDSLRPRGNLLPGTYDTLPGLNLPREEKDQQQVRARVASMKKQHPEALGLAYKKDEGGKFVIDEKGRPKPETFEYNLSDSPLANAVGKGLKGEARQKAFEQALGNKLAEAGKKALKNPEIEAGRTWYSTARTRLKNLFGDDTKLFTELLAATSARTTVETNYKFALEAYNEFKQGKYDATIKKYREGKTRWDRGQIQDYVKATGNENPTRGQFLDWWVEEHNLSPVQSHGKKFGMNSWVVLRVLDGSWAESVVGPKTPNFAGNLAGTTFEATVDIWAARALHRLAHEGNTKPWRILPPNETGVTDKDFNIGQAAYRHAAEKLGMKPDALQAVLWFAEKDYWDKHGWTDKKGAEKSDFNALLKETKPTSLGMFKIKSSQQALDLGVKPGDITIKK